MPHLNINALQSSLVDDIAVLLNGGKDLSILLQQITEKVQTFLEVDRVKIYQFAADGSGEVVAEAIDGAKLPTLRGLHFPASDIPPASRFSLQQAPHGTIVDVVSKHKTLCQGLFLQTKPSTLLDSKSEIYEPVDPCHLQYLLNMGVLTSLTLPILQNEGLWGLIVAHHSQPKRFTRAQLATLDVITREITIGITQKNLLQQAKQQEQEELFLHHIEARFLHNLNPWSEEKPFKAEDIESLLTQMLEIFQADSSALYIPPGMALERSCVYSQGAAFLAELADYAPWQALIQGQQSFSSDRSEPETHAVTVQVTPQVYLTHSLTADPILYQTLSTCQVGSFLLIPVQSPHQWLGSLVLFRQEKSLPKLWAGQQDNDERNLFPRQSFQAWCEHQRTTAHWQPTEIQLGKKVGYHFYIVLLQKYLAHLIDYQAAHDPVTTLPNANFFGSQLILALNQTMAAGELVATLLIEITIDLNNFKYLKDAVGVSVADLLLRDVAQRLQNSLQQSRVEKALLARWHGTAFIVLLPGVLDHSEVQSCCGQLLESLEPSFSVQGNPVQVVASAGIAVAPYDGTIYEQLIERTELALQSAKRQGKGTFLAYTPHLNRDTPGQLEMEQALRQALKRQEFTLHYQPQMKATSGEIVALEALLRWDTAPSGGGSPATFIPLAEHLGLMEPLGLWVFQTACEQVMGWKQAGLNHCRISVNLSPFQLMDPQLCQQFERILVNTGAQPQDFTLEVTEKTVMENPPAVQSTLSQFRNRGFRVALDNFGTGASSLTVLRTLPIDTLKLAREFLQSVESGTQGMAFYQAMVDLGKSLNLEIIAEGVETSPQWDFVKLAGVQIVQGYGVTKPMESTLIMAWIRQQDHRRHLNTIAQGGLVETLALQPAQATPVNLSVITNLNEDQTYESVDQVIQQGILEYSQIQAMMRQQTEREHLVMQISNKIRQSLDLDYILSTLVTEVRQLLDCDRLFLFQFDANWLGKVVMESVADPSLSILGEWIDEPCFRNDYVELYRQGRVRAIDDITQVGLAPCHLEILQKYQVKANLVLPVLYQDELWGLMIAHQCQAVRHWLPGEITLLTEIAVQAAIAIHQGELYEELQQANQALENLATLDGLTKIANRRKFDQYLQQEWGRAERSRSPLSMILCDIDHFKKYNDTYGHQAGDACLQQVAKTLSQSVSRAMDLAARYGGEEFALILPDTSAQGALHLAQHVRSQIRSLEISHRASPFEVVTLSMGVATLIPQPGQDPSLLIQTADQSLYRAKETGRDRYCAEGAEGTLSPQVDHNPPPVRVMA